MKQRKQKQVKHLIQCLIPLVLLGFGIENRHTLTDLLVQNQETLSTDTTEKQSQYNNHVSETNKIVPGYDQHQYNQLANLEDVQMAMEKELQKKTLAGILKDAKTHWKEAGA